MSANAHTDRATKGTRSVNNTPTQPNNSSQSVAGQGAPASNGNSSPLAPENLTATNGVDSPVERTVDYAEHQQASRPTYQHASDRDSIDAHTGRQEAYLRAMDALLP